MKKRIIFYAKVLYVAIRVLFIMLVVFPIGFIFLPVGFALDELMFRVKKLLRRKNPAIPDLRLLTPEEGTAWRAEHPRTLPTFICRPASPSPEEALYLLKLYKPKTFPSQEQEEIYRANLLEARKRVELQKLQKRQESRTFRARMKEFWDRFDLQTFRATMKQVWDHHESMTFSQGMKEIRDLLLLRPMRRFTPK